LKKNNLYYGLLSLLLLIGCAKRGSISGGLKDTIPPVLKISFPNNYSTNFSGKTIKLTFDEYIKLKDINKQLIVSPPLSKKPQISPLTPSKTITVTFQDSLQPNTTYSLNFGQSIEDNNEGNKYQKFKYVFSTGPHIDSLAISGTIKDAYTKKIDSYVSVLLYEMNQKYTDSVIYKEDPRYITNTLDSSATFKIENIKAGKYVLVAVKDNNTNYRFDSKTEKIGFYNTIITVPNDSLFEIKLFKETSKFKAFKPSQSSGNSLIMGYEGNPKEAKLTLRKGNETLATPITKIEKKDSLKLWFKPFKIEKSAVDSLQFNVSKGNYNQDYTIKIKSQKTDTLSIAAKQAGILHLSDVFTLNPSIPLSKIDATKIQLFNKDSVAVAFKTEYDEMNLTLKFDFKKEPLEKYKLKILPEALTDYLDQSNKKELTYKFETKNISDYGNLRLNLENVKQFPVIIELTDKNEEVIYSYYSESATQIDFNLIKPDSYTLRVIYDSNKNKEWDSGNFLEKRQSEEVHYFPKEIDVRANWDVQQTFNLK
jgi:uncharacterized protein (DUF2141 family)